MGKAENNTFSLILKFAAQCRKKMIASILLAVIGSVCGVIPYFAVTRIIIRIFEQNYDLAVIVPWVIAALLGYLGIVWFSTASTTLSHRSAFTILKNIRIELTGKLARVPMGYILDKPSGEFKTCLLDTSRCV